MAWQDEMTILLRTMVWDLNAPQKYTDDSLQQVLAVAAQLVAAEADFSQQFVADVVNVAITPDPSDRANGTRDDDFLNLASMKAACIVDRGVARTESGILIRDNGSMVDLRAKLAAAMETLKVGWCKVYEDQKLAYQAGLLNGMTAGAAVLGPFREIANLWSGGGWGELESYYPIPRTGMWGPYG